LSDNPPVARVVDTQGGDDISVAKRLAEKYNAMGLDPARAYDDPETALQDFNLRDLGF
jgi:hypothetical protein